ncbi:hypothetical protein TNCV_34361 [Trichonephila clavipes]|nr:hypothetical protein TNCV_34361 [Trichonephila clavipes]
MIQGEWSAVDRLENGTYLVVIANLKRGTCASIKCKATQAVNGFRDFIMILLLCGKVWAIFARLSVLSPSEHIEQENPFAMKLNIPSL